MANILTFTNFTVTDANIYGGINYAIDLNPKDEFTVGNVASAEVSFETDLNTLRLFSKDTNAGAFTWSEDGVNRGKFYISEIVKSQGMYTITAYDKISLLSSPISELSITTPTTISALIGAITSHMGCSLVGTLTNSSLQVTELPSDSTTIRDLLGYALEYSGCSAVLNASENLKLIYYPQSNITVTASDYKMLEAADYLCKKIDNVQILSMAADVVATYGSGTNTLYIQNPLVTACGNIEASNIYNKVKDFYYTPLTCEMFDYNGIEAGTIATFGTAPTLVMSMTASQNGVIVSSVGNDDRTISNTETLESIAARVEETQEAVNSLAYQVINQLTDTTQTAYSLDVESGATLVTVNKYGGKSLVFNQLVQNGNFASTNAWYPNYCTISAESNILTCVATTERMTVQSTAVNSTQWIAGHKYFLNADVKTSSENNIRLAMNRTTLSTTDYYAVNTTPNTWHNIRGILTNANGTIGVRIGTSIGVTAGDTLQIKNVNVIDLTQMFGAGNEPTTVAEVKALLPNDYYEYNTGEVIHADVDKVVHTDTDEVSTEYPIPQAIRNLEGYGWSAGNVYNEVDFERKKFIKRVGRVDLGSLTWTKSSAYTNLFYSTISGCKTDTSLGVGVHSLCGKYENYIGLFSNMPDKSNRCGGRYISSTINGEVLIKDSDYSSSTASAFKTAMNGVYLYYELATPIEIDISETLEALSLEDGSTITFHNSNGDDYRIPVESKLMWYDSSLESRAKADSENASKTATNYIVADSSGLHVTDNVNNVGTENENSVRIDSDSVDIIKSGQTVAEYSQGLTVWSDNGTEIAHLGYGITQGGSGETDAPYYNLGVRKRGSAKGSYSVIEGGSTAASGVYSHAEGYDTTASGANAHAEGFKTKASGSFQHVQGKFNVDDDDDAYADIIGNGTTATRSNAYALDWSGNGHFAGDVYVGCNADSSGGTNIKDLIKVKTYTISSRSWASGGTWLTNAGISPTADTGYKIIGIVGAMPNSQSALIPNLVYNATVGQIRGYVRNVASSPLTDSIVVQLLEILE